MLYRSSGETIRYWRPIFEAALGATRARLVNKRDPLGFTEALAEIRSASISSGTRLSRSGGLGSSRRHAIGELGQLSGALASEHDIYREDAVLEYPQSDRRPAIRRPFPVLRGMGRTAKSGSAGKVVEGSSAGLAPDPEAPPLSSINPWKRRHRQARGCLHCGGQRFESPQLHYPVLLSRPGFRD
jgi:hypothetical protein